MIVKAGGEILLLDYDIEAEKVMQSIDGWLLPGGLDINPQHYNELPSK